MVSPSGDGSPYLDRSARGGAEARLALGTSPSACLTRAFEHTPAEPSPGGALPLQPSLRGSGASPGADELGALVSLGSDGVA